MNFKKYMEILYLPTYYLLYRHNAKILKIEGPGSFKLFKNFKNI